MTDKKSIVVCIRIWFDGRDSKTRFTVFHWDYQGEEDMSQEGAWLGRWMFHPETIGVVVNRVYNDMEVYSVAKHRNKSFNIPFDVADNLMMKANNVSIAYAGKKFSVTDISIPMQ